MATQSHPSPQSPDDDTIPTATLALPSTASRRLPPPCWSPEETVALIESYRDKWYSLHRGNLRANHWQEVADEVASRCPVPLPKTAVQCRHKMEKLRKRYRSEIQRSAGLRRFISTWPHFQSMHAMDKGPNPTPPSSSDEDDVDFRRRVNDSSPYGYNNSSSSINNNSNQKFGVGAVGGVYGNGGVPTGVRIKIPGRMPANSPSYGGYDEMGSGVNVNSNPYARFATNSVPSGYGAGAGGGSSSKVVRERFVGRSEMGSRMSEVPKRKTADGGIGEVAASIQALGEGFMRIEKVKMDMARQVEEMRMEMELKRTEMILDSQQRIVEAFAKAMGERCTKRVKRMPGSP